MKKSLIVLLVIVFVISACNSNTPVATQVAETTLPSPVVEVTSAPDIESTMQQFFDYWNTGNYTSLYEMLSQTSKDAINLEDFSKRYSETAQALTLQEIEGGITSTLVKTSSAKVGYQVNFLTNLFGVISRTMEMDLVLEAGQWKILWQEGLIMPELTGGNRLVNNIQAPSRGDINDRNGNTLVKAPTGH